MRIFALETDPQRIIRRYCHEGECAVLVTRYHGLSFLFATLREMLITVLCFGVIVLAWRLAWPMGVVLFLVAVVWFVFVFFAVVKAFLDWRFDMIIVTTDKIILVDQTSIFRQEVKPMHLENVGGISASTQFWNIFPFGQLTIHLKEGLGGDSLVLRYVPDAQRVAATISDVVTRFQRRNHPHAYRAEVSSR